MQLQNVSTTVFYRIEKAIKVYRQFAQRNIKAVYKDVTVDQWLTLKTLHENPSITQKEIGIIVFKDYASVTRIVELLVKKKFLERSIHESDRRRFNLVVTPAGEKMIHQLTPIVAKYRTVALAGITIEEIQQLQNTLDKIISNCPKT